MNFGKDLPQFGQSNGYIEGGSRGEVHSDPMMWVSALDLLLSRMKEDGVDFSSVDVGFRFGTATRECLFE